MIRHVVMFTWADSVDEAHISATAAALSELPDRIDTIRSYTLGSDVGISDANFDFAVVADFDDVAGFETYRDHPDHQQVIAANIGSHITQRVAVQFEV